MSAKANEAKTRESMKKDANCLHEKVVKYIPKKFLTRKRVVKYNFEIVKGFRGRKNDIYDGVENKLIEEI